MDRKGFKPIAVAPCLDTMIDLRTPSFSFNHGGLYAPIDPRTCDTPGGPCEYCEARIDALDAAEALVLLSRSCCVDRPSFLEPCPDCNAVGSFVTHAEKGYRCCNGCENRLCIRCPARMQTSPWKRPRSGLPSIPAGTCPHPRHIQPPGNTPCYPGILPRRALRSLTEDRREPPDLPQQSQSTGASSV